MALLQRGFRRRSKKRSSAGRAFNKRQDAHENTERSGSMRFLKRLFRKAGLQLQGNSTGQAELTLLAQLGDMDAIQMLAESGYDAKDNLGTNSLAIAAMGGDADAARILGNRGVSLTAKTPIFIVPQQQH